MMAKSDAASGTAPMNKVPLEIFQRDFLLTHLKNKPKCVLDELQAMHQGTNPSFVQLMMKVIENCWSEQTAFRCDNWYSCEIPLEKCYFAYTDFRGYRVPKDGRFVDFLGAHVQEIESHSFPMSREIRSAWTPMPRVMVEERDADDWTKRVTDTNAASNGTGRERYYVLDGQLRVIRHWYRQVPIVKAYIYRGTGSV
jgi:hypothetical protein